MLAIAAVLIVRMLAADDAVRAPQVTPGALVAPDASTADPIDRARAAENAGKLELAIAAYRDAPGADPLFRIGELYERLGKRVEAATYFTRYLEVAPDASDRAAVTTRIAGLLQPRDVAMTPSAIDAAPDRPPVSAPKARKQRCRCLPVDDNHGNNVGLCSAKQPARCQCESAASYVMCQTEFVTCKESEPGCEFWGQGVYARCSDPGYKDFHSPGEAGKPCTGVGNPDATRETGTYLCQYCSDTMVYTGSDGDSCTGYYQFTGERLTGRLAECN